jgi:hypothetical protein
MTRLFLAAGVAALAIAAPAAAKPGGGHGGNQAQPAQRGGGGGGGGGQAFRGGGGGGHGGGGGFAEFRGGGGHGGGGGGFAAFRGQGGGGHGQNQAYARQQVRGGHGQQQAFTRQQVRGGHGQNQAFARQQVRGGHGQNQAFARQEFRGGHSKSQAFARQEFRGGHGQNRAFARQQFQTGGIGNRDQGHFNRQLAGQDRVAAHQAFQASRFAALNAENRARIAAPMFAERFVGAPVRTVAALGALPPAISYLYPDTPDYYYRYGDGYLYEVNRSNDVIAALLPLMAGGYLPGQYLPNYYMSSYVPAYYGFNRFYPDYGNDCYRYGYGVVYEVDCFTGFVEDVIPLYAGGYGVGQMLPSAYSYYNVPMQYRPLYYDTPDYGYWYAPGAIYQYDRGTSLITSVAALMSPGFTVGRPLPVGYGVYNVPYAYRATYYDSPSAWYRYNNGYIYQVDPATMLVNAIVASVLT